MDQNARLKVFINEKNLVAFLAFTVACIILQGFMLVHYAAINGIRPYIINIRPRAYRIPLAPILIRTRIVRPKE